MAEPAPRPWTIDDFFAWQERQAGRYELVGGRPLKMMAGAGNVHDDIVVNILAELRTQLRGGPCRPFTRDGSLETLPGQIRRPDLGVDGGRREPNGLRAAAPRPVGEVLSPGTRDFDTFEKLGEYKAVDGLDHILFVDPDAPQLVHRAEPVSELGSATARGARRDPGPAGPRGVAGAARGLRGRHVPDAPAAGRRVVRGGASHDLALIARARACRPAGRA